MCLTCVHAETCAYPKNPGLPFLECEEFEGLTLAPKRAPSPEAEWTVLEKETDRGGSLGLCVNCEERSTCVYAKSGQAVLQCGEYR